MRLQFLSSLLLLSFSACPLTAQTTTNPEKFSPTSRTFRFTYRFTVKELPAGAKQVRVWAPVPQTDRYQTVLVLRVKAPAKTQMTREPEFGNRMLYIEMLNPTAEAEFTIEYEVTRREYSRGDYDQLRSKDQKPGAVPASMDRFVSPDNLIPTDGKIRALAVEVTGSQTGTVAKPRLPMITCSQICATTRRAQAGDVTRCGPANPSMATARTSILRSSAC